MTYHTQGEFAGLLSLGKVRLKECSQVVSHFVFGDGVNILKSILSSFKWMKCSHFDHTLESC